MVEDDVWTVERLEKDIERLAHGLLASDIRPTNRIAVLARSSAMAVRALVAVGRAGAVHVPVNPGYREDELAHVLRDSGASALWIDVLDDELREVLARVEVPSSLRLVIADGVTPLACTHIDADTLAHRGDARAASSSGALPTPGPDDLAMLIYTSGTTGRSKGCEHTHRDLAEGVDALMGLWAIGPHDVVVHALPLFHVHGLCVALIGALRSGAQVRLLPRFSPAAVVDAIRDGGTVFMSVPTMIARLLAHLAQHPDDGATLGRARLVTCGSAALPAADLDAFERATGQRILERYGMSESLITMSNPLHGERRAGTVGLPVPGTEIRIVDDELQVRTPGMMRGYRGRPDEDDKVFVRDEDGRRWLKTGDIVARDDDGYVRIVGRASQDILKVGGYKLSAREIEEALVAHPAIAEVSVIGLPDREWGERVVACVVVDSAWTGPRDEALLRALQDFVRLHETKKPRGLLVVDALPRNALGKVLKPALKARADEVIPAS